MTEETNKEKKKEKKKEFPELDELVVCTVKKIVGTTIFVDLDEYNKEGVMTLSEVAPGRIRNIRDYVAPNKKIVCKVLRIDKPKNHIDLSLRRVSKKDQKEILDIYNKEKSNIIILKLINAESLAEKIKEEYNTITNFFDRFIENKEIAKKFLNEQQIKRLVELIKEKEKKVKVNLKIKIEHPGTQGIEVIKQTIIKNKADAEINYISAPFYSIILEGKSYKEVNKKIKEIAEKIVQDIKIKGGKAEIIEK